jgi:hypothetical protein
MQTVHHLKLQNLILANEVQKLNQAILRKNHSIKVLRYKLNDALDTIDNTPTMMVVGAHQ